MIPSSAPNTQYPILCLLTIPIPIPEVTSFILIKNAYVSAVARIRQFNQFNDKMTLIIWKKIHTSLLKIRPRIIKSSY